MRRILPCCKWRQQASRAWLGLAVAVLFLLGRSACGASEIEGDLASELATEINRRVTNPVSTTWSLELENTLSLVDVTGHGGQAEDSIAFQPVLPIWLNRELKLITRPKLTLLKSKPYAGADGGLERANGFGDTVLDLVLSPRAGPWLLALGPTWIFPSASSEQTGQGKWQVGPGGVAGYKSDRWLAGLIFQQWWSFAGDSSRDSVSQMHLQYLASWFFDDGWSIGTEPTIKFDWRASSGDVVTFPIGPFVAKVVKPTPWLPIKLEIQTLYYPVAPASNGTFVELQLKVIPVVRSPVDGPLL